MPSWTADEQDRIGRATELSIASRRADGTLGPHGTIWGVRAGCEVYVRSAYGPDNGWYRRAKSRGRGWLRAGGSSGTCGSSMPRPKSTHRSMPPTTSSTTATVPRSSAPGSDPPRLRSPSAFGHRRRLTVLTVPPFTLINRGGDAGPLHEEWVNIA